MSSSLQCLWVYHTTDLETDRHTDISVHCLNFSYNLLMLCPNNTGNKLCNTQTMMTDDGDGGGDGDNYNDTAENTSSASQTAVFGQFPLQLL